MDYVVLINKFEEYLDINKNFSYNTIKSYTRDINNLMMYVDEKKKEEYTWVNESFLKTYINSLKKESFSNSTLSRRISSLNIFLKFLFEEKIVSEKINLNIKMDKKEREQLVIFTREEIYNILNISPKTLNDYRDKAIFELCYSIGIKPTECVNLEIKDINLEIGYLKYKTKEGYRIIPLNDETLDSIKVYLEEIKNHKINLAEDNKLFITSEGHGITRQAFWKIFKKRQQELKLDKELNTMNFRNSLAIHLLEDGIAAEDVQEILGLKNINSLKLHFKTLQNSKNIKRVILNHPRSNMK